MTTDPVRWPAEWEAQAAVLLTWPHADGDWGEGLAGAEQVFSDIAGAVAGREHVIVVCRDADHRRGVAERLSRAGVSGVRLFEAPSNDSWARDHGPIAVQRGGRPVLLDFHFNGWGGRHAFALDDAITAALHSAGAFGGTDREPVDWILEGGSIDGDGRGTVLTTARCLLSATRNRGADRAAVARRLREKLGTQRCLWLEHGHLEGDDTDDHIDMLARFTDAETIAYTACEDRDDPQFTELAAMRAELERLRRADGLPYRLLALPLPRAQYHADGGRLPLSYANFLAVNGAVLVPAYDDPADRQAQQALGGCFPGRDIVGIDCRALTAQGGSLHCASMQLPAAIEVGPGL